MHVREFHGERGGAYGASLEPPAPRHLVRPGRGSACGLLLPVHECWPGARHVPAAGVAKGQSQVERSLESDFEKVDPCAEIDHIRGSDKLDQIQGPCRSAWTSASAPCGRWVA